MWRFKPVLSLAKSVFGTPVTTTCTCASELPFLFIVGSGRSGNTLLRRLIMEQFSIYIPPETYVLPQIADYRLRARALAWPALVDLVVSAFEYHPEFSTFGIDTLREFALEAKKWPRNRQTLPDLLRRLYQWFRSVAGVEAEWLGDKTPSNTQHLGRIDVLFPSARYVHLIRDGVDVVQSYLTANLYNSHQEAALRWVQSVRCWHAFRTRLPKERYIEIRYENLVRDSDSTLLDIATQFSIPKRATPLNGEMLLGDVGTRPQHENVKNEVNSNSIGKGRSRTEVARVKKIAHIMNPTLEKLGYMPL